MENERRVGSPASNSEGGRESSPDRIRGGGGRSSELMTIGLSAGAAVRRVTGLNFASFHLPQDQQLR
jgi:hypothetical protein